MKFTWGKTFFAFVLFSIAVGVYAKGNADDVRGLCEHLLSQPRFRSNPQKIYENLAEYTEDNAAFRHLTGDEESALSMNARQLRERIHYFLTGSQLSAVRNSPFERKYSWRGLLSWLPERWRPKDADFLNVMDVRRNQREFILAAGETINLLSQLKLLLKLQNEDSVPELYDEMIRERWKRVTHDLAVPFGRGLYMHLQFREEVEATRGIFADDQREWRDASIRKFEQSVKQNEKDVEKAAALVKAYAHKKTVEVEASIAAFNSDVDKLIGSLGAFDPIVKTSRFDDFAAFEAQLEKLGVDRSQMQYDARVDWQTLKPEDLEKGGILSIETLTHLSTMPAQQEEFQQYEYDLHKRRFWENARSQPALARGLNAFLRSFPGIAPIGRVLTETAAWKLLFKTFTDARAHSKHLKEISKIRNCPGGIFKKIGELENRVAADPQLLESFLRYVHVRELATRMKETINEPQHAERFAELRKQWDLASKRAAALGPLTPFFQIGVLDFVGEIGVTSGLTWIFYKVGGISLATELLKNFFSL